MCAVKSLHVPEGFARYCPHGSSTEFDAIHMGVFNPSAQLSKSVTSANSVIATRKRQQPFRRQKHLSRTAVVVCTVHDAVQFQPLRMVVLLAEIKLYAVSSGELEINAYAQPQVNSYKT